MNIPARKTMLLFCAAALAWLPLFGNTYSDLKSALKSVLPTGSVYKTTLTLTKAQAKDMNAFGQADFWEGDKFTLYYTKTPDNKTDTVAVEILEILSKYQAMHTWVIGLKPDGTRTGLAVLELTDHYSFPLAERRYLDRFKSRSAEGNSKTVESVDVVSGATESSMLLRYSIKRVQYLIAAAGLK